MEQVFVGRPEASTGGGARREEKRHTRRKGDLGRRCHEETRKNAARNPLQLRGPVHRKKKCDSTTSVALNLDSKGEECGLNHPGVGFKLPPGDRGGSRETKKKTAH